MIPRMLSMSAALMIYFYPALNPASSTPIMSSTRGTGSVVLPIVCNRQAAVICVNLAKDYCRRADPTADPRECYNHAYPRCLKAHRCDALGPSPTGISTLTAHL